MMVGPSGWPWAQGAEVGWRSRSLECGGWLDILTWALTSREQQLWCRCPSLKWMMESCVDDSEKRGRGRWHGNPRTRVFTWGWEHWDQVDEHHGLVWEKQGPGELASHGTAVVVWAPYSSHIKVPKPFKNVKIFLRLLLQMFAGSVSLSHPSSFSSWYCKHTHCYSLFIHLLFIFTITQLSRHKSPIPTHAHLLKGEKPKPNMPVGILMSLVSVPCNHQQCFKIWIQGVFFLLLPPTFFSSLYYLFLILFWLFFLV